MAHKTFISYKYSESKDVRDRIIAALGDDATYYKGETSESPDLKDASTERIRKYLKDKLYNTSVTIVVLSPNMGESQWIDWEIEYSLKKTTRKGRVSQTNGVVAVIQKVNGNYDWFKSTKLNCHGKIVSVYKMDNIYPIIQKNHFNSNPVNVHCEECMSYDFMDGSYITFVEEDIFLNNAKEYIENAHDKSENDGEGYNIVRTRKAAEEKDGR